MALCFRQKRTDRLVKKGVTEMEMNEREVYISPMIQEMIEADLHFKKIVIMSICRFVSRVSFGSISAVQRHIKDRKSVV